jgi:hypothetical protein
MARELVVTRREIRERRDLLLARALRHVLLADAGVLLAVVVAEVAPPNVPPVAPPVSTPRYEAFGVPARVLSLNVPDRATNVFDVATSFGRAGPYIVIVWLAFERVRL